ncbi:MAG: hypothetical protein FJX64_07235 [Alphaproteobacteria bacterium]|nr:hypothetical protein [Alphaproteobacteria bacterium]
MTMVLPTPEVSAMRTLFARVRAEAMRSVTMFLRKPMGWLMIAAVLGGAGVYAHIREGNRVACAATSVTLDQQTFREIVAGGLGGGPAFFAACEGMALPGPIWARMRNTRNWAY